MVEIRKWYNWSDLGMQKIKNKKNINENNLLAVKNKDKLTIFLRSKFENHRSTLGISILGITQLKWKQPTWRILILQEKSIENSLNHLFR